MQGFYCITNFGFDNIPAPKKSLASGNITPAFPCPSPGSKRSLANHYGDDPDTEESQRTLRVNRVEKEKAQKIQLTVTVLCRIWGTQDSKTDPRFRRLLGEAHNINSAECETNKDAVLKYKDIIDLPALAKTSNTPLLTGMFSVYLKVKANGEVDGSIHLLTFLPRDSVTKQYAKIKDFSKLTAALKNLVFTYTKIEACNTLSQEDLLVSAFEASVAVSPGKTDNDHRSVVETIFSQMQRMLDQVGLDYIVEVISQKIHDVFALFRNSDNLALSKKEFLKLAIKAAEVNPTTITGKTIYPFFYPGGVGGVPHYTHLPPLKRGGILLHLSR